MTWRPLKISETSDCDCPVKAAICRFEISTRRSNRYTELMSRSTSTRFISASSQTSGDSGWSCEPVTFISPPISRPTGDACSLGMPVALVKCTSAKLIGGTDQFVPLIVIARPIGAAQDHNGFSTPTMYL